MSGTVNKVILIGNVGTPPDIRTFPNGGRVANLSLATSEKWRDKKSGERKEATEWHRIAIFNEGLVQLIEKYVNKGSRLYIEGKQKTRKFTTKDGIEKYTTETHLRGYNCVLELLDTKDKMALGAPPDYHEDQHPLD